VALPLSEAGLASVTLVDELLDLLDKGPMPGRLLHLVISADVVCNPDENLQQGLQKPPGGLSRDLQPGGTRHERL
jgi:hypothetical protein